MQLKENNQLLRARVQESDHTLDEGKPLRTDGSLMETCCYRKLSKHFQHVLIFRRVPLLNLMETWLLLSANVFYCHEPSEILKKRSDFIYILTLTNTWAASQSARNSLPVHHWCVYNLGALQSMK